MRRFLRAALIVLVAFASNVTVGATLVARDPITLGIEGHLGWLAFLVLSLYGLRAFLVFFAPAWLVHRGAKAWSAAKRDRSATRLP